MSCGVKPGKGKHLFVASEFLRFPPRQIRYLRATSRQGFWADHKAGQTSELALRILHVRPIQDFASPHLPNFVSGDVFVGNASLLTD